MVTLKLKMVSAMDFQTISRQEGRSSEMRRGILTICQKELLGLPKYCLLSLDIQAITH
jgi:hypothetical protein